MNVERIRCSSSLSLSSPRAINYVYSFPSRNSVPLFLTPYWFPKIRNKGRKSSLSLSSSNYLIYFSLFLRFFDYFFHHRHFLLLSQLRTSTFLISCSHHHQESRKLFPLHQLLYNDGMREFYWREYGVWSVSLRLGETWGKNDMRHFK